MAQAVLPAPDGHYPEGNVGAFESGGATPNLAKRYDFNRDGYPDYVILQSTTDQSSPLADFPAKQTKIWYLQNLMPGPMRLGPKIERKWVLKDAADFNRDGYPDYALFDMDTRHTQIQYLKDNLLDGEAVGPLVPVGWILQRVGDFNGDGWPDYVLVNPSTRQTAIWYLQNNRIKNVPDAQNYGPTLDPGWDLQAVADFDSDGIDDYLVFKSTSPRETKIWYIVGRRKDRVAGGPTIDIGWVLRGAADFNKDHQPDYLLYRQATKQTQVLFLDKSITLIGQAFGPTIPRDWFPGLPGGG
jgi:hypothetical protein